MSVNTLHRSKKRRGLLGLLLFVWMGVIFLLSSADSMESSQTSSEFAHWILNVLTSAGIINACNITEPDFALIHSILRNMAHFFEYLVLGILSQRFFAEINLTRFIRPTLTALIFCALYALTDELHQMFVPGRAADIMDVLIDLTGSGIGILMMSRIKLHHVK